MQQNNSWESEDSHSDDPTASMERTSAGRWAVPPVSAVPAAPSPRPPQPTVVHEASPPPPPQDSTEIAGSPSAGENGRWVPDPTVQLTRSAPQAPPAPAPHTGDPFGYGAGGHVTQRGVDEVTDYAEPNGFGNPNGFGGPNGFETPNGFDGHAGYDMPNGLDTQNSLDTQNGRHQGWPDEGHAQPPQPYDQPGAGSDGHRFDEDDFFGQPSYGDGGLTDGYGSSNPTNATGAYEVVDDLGHPGGHTSFGPGPDHGYQDPTGLQPYSSDGAFDDGGFNDGEFGGSDPIDAIDNDGRNFDEEELETGMAARRNAIEWAVVLVAAVLLALVLRAVLLQAFYIPSPSMEDTLLVDDRVLVNKLSYRLNDISRGDIVVFHRTDAEIAASAPDDPKDVIKRVIATEGERIEIRDNQVLIDDQLLVEPYLDPNVSMADFGPQIVPDGHIFVMGDNRNLSSDSRGETGPVPEERVVGRAFFLFWPVNRLSAL